MPIISLSLVNVVQVGGEAKCQQHFTSRVLKDLVQTTNPIWNKPTGILVPNCRELRTFAVWKQSQQQGWKCSSQQRNYVMLLHAL